MSDSLGKNALLSLASIIFASGALVGAYELYRDIEYARWHEEYTQKGDWYGQITVPSPDPILMWEYGPNRSNAAHHLATNRYGFRQSDDVSKTKPAGTHRVAFIGDSVTLGLLVPESGTFVSQFRSMGDGHFGDKRLESLNFGVDGYNTLQIEQNLKTKVVDYSPDHVIYMLCLNDFDFDDASGLKIYYFKKPRSFTLRSLSTVHRRMFFDGMDFHTYSFSKNNKQVFQSIYRMSKLLDEKNIIFSVVVLPIFQGSTVIDMVRGARTIPTDSFADYAVAPIHWAIAEALARHGIHVVDLLEAFSRQGQPPSHYAFDVWHPNERGHRLIARALADAILPPGQLLTSGL